ncbi:MAG: Gfo/Idh/MocA family oxidoreductase [Phycisphaeraceae bacterium]
MPKRIGYVDLDLDNFHAKTFLNVLRDKLADRGCQIVGGTALEHEPSRRWAGEMNLPYFDDIAQLDAQVDGYIILAPNNPELHLKLCEMTFPFGKPTYVDKTFAPDLATAQAIFTLADKHGVPVQTASALRFTNVQERVAELGGSAAVKHIVAWSPGRSFADYTIHPVEMVVSVMGPQARRVLRRGDDQFMQLVIDFAGDRTAIANVHLQSQTAYAAGLTTQATTEFIVVDTGAMWTSAVRDMVAFFDHGKPTIHREESLAIRKILDAAFDPRAVGAFVTLP